MTKIQSERNDRLATVLRDLSKALIDKGLLIEAGWICLRDMTVSKDAPQVQLDEMRNAFFAGAHHVFSSIMSTLDSGDDATDADLRRISQINDELDRFITGFNARFMRTRGSA
jgi:hypothetical protein